MHLDVHRIAADRVHRGARGVEAADLVGAPLGGGETGERGCVAGEEVRDVEHVRGAVPSERLDREGAEHRAHVVGAHGERDAERVVGVGVGGDGAQDDAVRLPLEAHEALVHAAAGGEEAADPGRHPRDARHEQMVAPEERIGQFEEPALLDLVHGDHPGVGDGLVGDDLRVRSWAAACGGALGALRLLARRATGGRGAGGGGLRGERGGG